MVNVCFVPGCRTGYKKGKQNRSESVNRKLSIFRAPKNPSDLQRWNEAIRRNDRNISPKDYVCELHFTEDCIERFNVTKLFDGAIHMMAKRPALKKGSIPSLFPTVSSYLSTDTQEDLSSESMEEMEEEKIDGLYIEDIVTVKIEEEESDDMVINFTALVENLELIKTPNRWWSKNILVDFMAFTRWDEDFTVQKKIIVDACLNVKIFFGEHEVCVNKIRRVSNIDNLCMLMKTVEDLKVCKTLLPRTSRLVPQCYGYVKAENMDDMCNLCVIREKNMTKKRKIFSEAFRNKKRLGARLKVVEKRLCQ